ncbi:MAG: glycosyl hydrolase family 18 protein, partial [Porticoccaceae bacterium]|nr:glycosyl hydrolase family 18 protein [Porticoccaceae bacterium]
MTLCKTRLTAAGIAILLSITLATPGQAEPVVGSYYAANGTPQEIPQLPGDKLTHILYAFLALCGDNSGAGETTRKALSKACNGKQDFEAVLINGDQTIADLTAFKQLKHKHPHLVLLPSFGGWTLSQPFHDMALKDEYRQRFVRSALALVEHHQVFDGIDIDWEFPGGGGATQPSLSGAA